MSDNPYAPPKSELINDQLPELVLASRLQRFVAYTIDWAIIIGIVLAGVYVADLGRFVSEEESLVANLVISLIAITVFGVVNGYLLVAKGQTIGKRICNIRIADMDGNVPSIYHSLVLRMFPVELMACYPHEFLSMVPYIVDALCIFREDKRCLHDLIAGTQVVKV